MHVQDVFADMRSGAGNRGVKSNGFNFCLDSPTSLHSPYAVGGRISDRLLHTVRGLFRLYARSRRVSTKGVTVKIETSEQGSSDRRGEVVGKEGEIWFESGAD